MKKIELTQGKFALVDDEDFEWLNQWKWYANHLGYTWYVVRSVRYDNEVKAILMHRSILNAKIGEEIDHINHNGLDNRKKNLRICTRSQNNMNRNKLRGTYKYKGV